MEIFEDFEAHELPKLIQANGGSNVFELSCPGGGRIEHKPTTKELFVYGYSQSYGQPDHTVAVGMLQKDYPDCTITWSNEGY